MWFLELLKIGGSWIWTGVVYVALIAALVALLMNWARVTNFLAEVRGELRKANWPWESDPKIKGIKKYKELVDSTIVVLIAVILLAGFVQFWDFFDVLIVGFLHKTGGQLLGWFGH